MVTGSRGRRTATSLFSSPIEYDLTVDKSGDSLWVQGPGAGEALPHLRPLPGRIRLFRRIGLGHRAPAQGGGAEDAEVELQSEEMDLYYFEGEEIDLDPYVFEEVMLNIPIKALCSESCKGMCPSCGQNLNIETATARSRAQYPCREAQTISEKALRRRQCPFQKEKLRDPGETSGEPTTNSHPPGSSSARTARNPPSPTGSARSAGCIRGRNTWRSKNSSPYGENSS